MEFLPACTTTPATTSALVEHPAPNLEPGDFVVLANGREALATARVETGGGQLAALLEVVVAGSPDAPLSRRWVVLERRLLTWCRRVAMLG